MLTHVTVAQQFTDFDGRTVISGTYVNATIVRMGYSHVGKCYFWNIISNDNVFAVTRGYPTGAVDVAVC